MFRKSFSIFMILGFLMFSFNSFAGTVSVKGNTQAELYGFIYTEFSENNHMTGNPDRSNMPSGEHGNILNHFNKTNFSSNNFRTRLGLNFKNEDVNLNGKIEGDFDTDGNYFRLRQAYIQHNFGTFDILIGKTYALETISSSISIADAAPVGFNMNGDKPTMIKISSGYDFGFADVKGDLAFEDNNEDLVQTGVNGTVSVVRKVFPTTVLRLSSEFENPFGKPISVYGWGSIIPVYLTGNTITDDSETSYGVGFGINAPIYFADLGSNFIYSKGATGYAGMTDYVVPSYVENNGDKEKTRMYAFNINLTVSPFDKTQFGTEYDYVKFSNDYFQDDKRVKTFLLNSVYKTTKYTSIALEYRHVKAENFTELGTDNNVFSGNQVFAIYKYNF